MRSVLTSVMAAVIVAAGVATSVGAQMQSHPVYVAPELRNAAIPYWRAFAQMKPEDSTLISDVDWDACGENFDRAKMPASFGAAAAMDISGTRADLIEATSLARCNFECAWENGFGTTLPHLAKLRAGARLLRFDARKAAVEGDVARAVEDLIAIRKMARHTAIEPIAITKLVAMAIDSLACTEIESLAKSGLMTRAQRDALGADFALSNLNDLFAMSDFIYGERSMLAPKMGNKVEAAAVREALKPMTGAEPTDATAKLAAFTDAELLEDCAKLSACYDVMEKEWKSAEPMAGLAKIEEASVRGEYGQIARVTVPAFTNIRRSYDKAVARVRTTTEAVKNAKTKD